MQQAVSLFHMLATFAIISAALVSYVMDRVPIAVTSLAVIVVLLLFFYFFPLTSPEGLKLIAADSILQGFSNPALITIMALLVIGQGMFQTDAFAGISRKISRLSGNKPLILIFAITVISSAFINNTPVVVMFLPVITAIAHKKMMNTSKIAMPLSYFSIIGGMLTIIGSSTNLLVAELSQKSGGPKIDFFTQTPIGLVMVAIGIIYITFIAPKIIPKRQSFAEQITSLSGKQFITELKVRDHQFLVGSTAKSGLFPALKDMTVLLVRRDDRAFLPPFEDVTLLPGDVVIVAATRDVISKIFGESGIDQASLIQEKDNDKNKSSMTQMTITEALIAPGSRYIGQILEQTAITAATGCLVIGVQRRNHMARQGFDDIRLNAGDVLLLIGNNENILNLRFNHDLVSLEWSATEVVRRHKAWLAQIIFAAVIVLTSTGIMPMVIAAISGALAMIISGCLNIRQAARSFDSNILLLIVAAIAMAVPLEATGGAYIIATQFTDWLANASDLVLLSGFFILIAIVTNFLSNNAAAILFTPIAINIAAKTGIPSEALIMAVIFGANCSFASPIGYQTNLLVMSTGNYRFSDYVRVGVPLVILLWLSFTAFASWYYNL